LLKFNIFTAELSRHLTHSESCALLVHQPLIKTAKDALQSDKNVHTAIKVFLFFQDLN